MKQSIWVLVMEDFAARDEFGIRKYKVPLTVDTPKDLLKEAYEEALDLAVYLRGEIERRKIQHD